MRPVQASFVGVKSYMAESAGALVVGDGVVIDGIDETKTKALKPVIGWR